MVAADWPPRLIAFVLAVPAGVAAFFLGKIILLLFPGEASATRATLRTAAFAIGVTGAIGWAVLGTTMNEWPIAALTLAALFIVVRAIAATSWAPVAARSLMAAGFIAGLASGLKLTAATYALAMCVALLFRRPLLQDLRAGVREALVVRARRDWRPRGIDRLVVVDPVVAVRQSRVSVPQRVVPFALVGRVAGARACLRPVHVRRTGSRSRMTCSGRDRSSWRRSSTATRGCRPFIRSRSWRGRSRSSPFVRSRAARRRARLSAPAAAPWYFVGGFWLVAFLLWTAQHSHLSLSASARASDRRADRRVDAAHGSIRARCRSP